MTAQSRGHDARRPRQQITDSAKRTSRSALPGNDRLIFGVNQLDDDYAAPTDCSADDLIAIAAFQVGRQDRGSVRISRRVAGRLAERPAY